jgi:LmbE family N-acetylglucosaminyl deacetylase
MRDVFELGWLGHRWPVVDEPSREARVAALDRLCSDDPKDRPRVLMVVSHADDEVAWAGSRLAFLRDRVTLVYVTDGAPHTTAALRDSGYPSHAAYAAARRAERDRALALAGIEPGQVHDLDYADQEAKHHLAALARRVDTFIEATAPDIVLTHGYEGGHVDHDATACAVHGAIRARRRAGRPTPVLIEFAGYHRRFGRPRAFRFLPAQHCESRTLVLPEAMQRLKREMYACFPSQAPVLRYFPIAVERLRCAPRYDFRKPANWEHVLFADQAVAGDPRRTLPARLVEAAEAELFGD